MQQEKLLSTILLALFILRLQRDSLRTAEYNAHVENFIRSFGTDLQQNPRLATNHLLDKILKMYKNAPVHSSHPILLMLFKELASHSKKLAVDVLAVSLTRDLLEDTSSIRLQRALLALLAAQTGEKETQLAEAAFKVASQAATSKNTPEAIGSHKCMMLLYTGDGVIYKGYRPLAAKIIPFAIRELSNRDKERCDLGLNNLITIYEMLDHIYACYGPAPGPEAAAQVTTLIEQVIKVAFSDKELKTKDLARKLGRLLAEKMGHTPDANDPWRETSRYFSSKLMALIAQPS
jgi:hypothetical protein